MKKPNPELFELKKKKAKEIKTDHFDTSGMPKIQAKKERPGILSPTQVSQVSTNAKKPAKTTDNTAPSKQIEDPKQKSGHGSGLIEDQQLAGEMAKGAVGFLLPQSLHKKIDEAEQYLSHNYNDKLDRSAIVSAILGDPNLWTKKSLEKIVDSALFQLENRMADRMAKRMGKRLS